MSCTCRRTSTPSSREIHWAEAMRRVDAVINWQLRDLCGTTPRRWPLYEKTGAVVAFFGGVSRVRYVDVEGAASTKMDTGNAHSLQPRSIKVRALKASVCSLLRDVASVVRVAVCDQDDHQAASEALGELATVVVVPCGQKPRNLPFLALHDAVSTFAGKASRSPSRTSPGASPRAISASRRVEAPSRHRRDSCPSDEVVRTRGDRDAPRRTEAANAAAPSRALIGPDAPPLAQALWEHGRKGRRLRLAADGPEPLFAAGGGADGRRGAHAGVSAVATGTA